jgi:hypothetical protein
VFSIKNVHILSGALNQEFHFMIIAHIYFLPSRQGASEKYNLELIDGTTEKESKDFFHRECVPFKTRSLHIFNFMIMAHIDFLASFRQVQF